MRISTEPNVVLPSRVALAISHVVDDLQLYEEATSLQPSEFAMSELSFRPDDLPVHVRRLYNAAQNAWNELVNHHFPGQMARGTASLNGFRHYMIQDAKYLEYYVRVRMQSIANSGSKALFKEIVGFAETLSKSLKYSIEMRNICTQQLGIPEDIVANEPMSTQLKDSINLYEDVVKNPLGDWLAMHIVLLPCIMGYYAIASKLLEDPKIVTNTPYYPLWIQANASGSTFRRHISFINDSIERRDSAQRHWTYWTGLFTTACGTEKNFLDLALKESEYDTVAGFLCSIRSRVNGRFLSSNGENVVTEDRPDIWMLRPSRGGYNIMSVASNMSLVAVTITNSFPSYCDVKCTRTVETQWSINPIPNGKGYQLLWSPQLQYTLSVDVSGTETKVIAANNYKGTDQAWILEWVVLPAE